PGCTLCAGQGGRRAHRVRHGRQGPRRSRLWLLRPRRPLVVVRELRPVDWESRLMRSVLAVIAAIVAWMVIATAVNLALRAAWPGYHEAELTMQFTLAMMLARLALGALSSLCAGVVVAWIAKVNAVAAKV